MTQLSTSEPPESATGSPAVIVEEVKDTIVRALADGTTLPRHEDLSALHEELLAHIDAVMPLAAQKIDRLNRGSVEWYGKRSRLDTIPHEVDRGLGVGLLSAAGHVRSLGYTLRWLLENSGLVDGDR